MRQPFDENNRAIPLVTATKALAVTVNSSLSTFFDLTLQTGTTLIEVNALSQGVYMRYASGATTTVFDEYIQAGGVRHYVKPAGVTVVSFLQQAASSSIIVIEK